jgi:hypothetical protein
VIEARYLLELVRYLHLNPERIRSPMQAATYRWSSYGANVGKDNLVRIETAPVLGEFAKSVGKALSVPETYGGRESYGSPAGLL